MSNRAKRPAVVFALFDGMQMLDLAGPSEVFSLARDPRDGEQAYDIHHVSVDQHPIRLSTGLMVTGDPVGSAPVDIHTLVVPGAPSAVLARVLQDWRFMNWVGQTAARATRVASICTGAFVLGALGLLDGRRAATHWSAASRLAKACPRARVDADALFVEDGPVWTSAGVSAGIDLALALVRRDLGAEAALSVAREMVVHIVRNGGQMQFSRPLDLQARAGPDLYGLIPWIMDRLDRAISVEDMAEAMRLSVRSFQRQCTRTFGLPPAKLVVELRLERARTLLGSSDLPVSSVAAQVGFADAAGFSKAFAKRFAAPPSLYRQGFQIDADGFGDVPSSPTQNPQP